jgi:hypothetical protein
MIVRTGTFIVVMAAILGCSSVVNGATNIDPHAGGHRYGWTENGGWLNAYGDGALSGLTVRSDASLHGLHGFAWLENIGWVNFGEGLAGVPPFYSNTSASDFGVNLNTTTGALSGYAWGENVGWINFDPGAGNVVIDKNNGIFSGKAWGENIGWVSFDGLGASTAQTDPNAVPVTVTHFDIE